MKIVTNKEIAVKLDILLEEFREHRNEFKEHLKADEKMGLDLNTLKTIEEGRRWQLRTLWTATVGLALTMLAKTVWPQ